MRYKKNYVFIYNICYFLFIKYNYKKTFNYKIVQPKHARIKMYFCSFKTKIKGQFEAKPESQVKLTRFNLSLCENLSGYHHNFKIWLKSQFGTKPGSQGGLILNLDQSNDKNDYYRNFKTQLNGWPRVMLGSRVRRVNTNKNSYYHSFKFWLEDQPKAMSTSRVIRVNTG